MKKKPNIHIGKFADRTTQITVRETPQVVIFEFWFSKVGPWSSLADFDAFKAWVWEVIYPYDSDPRPSIVRCPITGEEGIIFAPPDGLGLEGKPPNFWLSGIVEGK